jgi:hypothetical protein
MWCAALGRHALSPPPSADQPERDQVRDAIAADQPHEYC